MVNGELARLRAQVLARQADVSRKISNYSRNKGVELAGSGFDPRANTDRISRMTTKQLKTLSKSLDSFMDRKNQFVGDFSGKPIHISVWREFKKSEARYNKRLTESYEKIKDIYIAPMKKTVEERRLHTQPKFPHMTNSAVNAVYEKSDMKPNQIAGLNGMARMIGVMGKKASAGYTKQELARAKVEFQSMIEIINDKEMESKFKDLSDMQVNILWNYTNFADRLSVSYNTKMRIKRDKKPLVSDSDKYAQSNEGAHRLLDWVKTVNIDS